MKLLALDPSFTATGWCVIDLASERVVAMGVIRNPVLKDERSKRATAAENDARRGLIIGRAVRVVHRIHKPAVTAIEGDAGSQHAKAAKGLARAQQACVDAIDALGVDAMPVFVTPQANKKRAVGRLSCTDNEMRMAMEARWGPSNPPDWIATLLRERPPYGQSPAPPGEWHNAVDSLGVANAAWDDPAVAGLRHVAKAAKHEGEPSPMHSPGDAKTLEERLEKLLKERPLQPVPSPLQPAPRPSPIAVGIQAYGGAPTAQEE